MHKCMYEHENHFFKEGSLQKAESSQALSRGILQSGDSQGDAETQSFSDESFQKLNCGTNANAFRRNKILLPFAADLKCICVRKPLL